MSKSKREKKEEQLRLKRAASTVSPSQGVLAQLVRAPPCHGGGCGFEPRRLRVFNCLKFMNSVHDCKSPCLTHLARNCDRTFLSVRKCECLSQWLNVQQCWPMPPTKTVP